MARPKLDRTKLRTRRIIFWLTEAEYLRLAQRAAALNVRVNAFARRLALAKPTSSEGNPSRDPVLIRQLYHIGHNLNQLVKNAHIFGRMSPRIERLCLRIEALMDEALGKEDP